MYKINYCGYNRSNIDYDSINRPNGSGDYLFLYFMTPMKVKLHNTTEITKKNACILYDIGYPQDYCALKKFTNSFFHFSCDSDLLKTYQLPLNQVFYPANHLVLNELIRQVYIEYLTKDPYYELHINATIEQFFIALARELNSLDRTPHITDELYTKFHEARIHILSNLENNWTNESMAKLTNLGKSQFYHYYQLFFHRSPKSELIEARIERAKYLLQYDTHSISQITLFCGFENVNHFTRYFKKSCNCTPSVYRKEMQSLH